MMPLFQSQYIGVLSIPSKYQNYDDGNYSYILQSYVDFIEQQGAQAILIKYTWSNQKIDELLQSVSGVLLTGGGANIFENESNLSKFAKKALYILKQAQQKNEKGQYFPVWGTCLGFELIQVFFAQGKKIFEKYEGQNHK